jgi:hypothetical protein
MPHQAQNSRRTLFHSKAYPADWAQPALGDWADSPASRHLALKKQAIDFLRELLTFAGSGEVYIQTDYVWSGEWGDHDVDIVIVDETGLPIIVIEVGRCDPETLQEMAQYGFLEIYHWSDDQQKPWRVVRPWDPQWDLERLQFEPVG